MTNPKILMIEQLKDKEGWLLPDKFIALDFVKSVPNIMEKITTEEQAIAADIVIQNWISNVKEGKFTINNNKPLQFKGYNLLTNGQEYYINKSDYDFMMNGFNGVVDCYNHSFKSLLKKEA